MLLKASFLFRCRQRPSFLSPSAGRRARCSLNLEPLEERTVPSFAGPLSYDVGSTPVGVAAVDFNGDGTFGPASSVNGDGTFRLGATYPIGDLSYSLLLNDYNGDGILDFAATSRGGMRVLLGSGDGTIRTDPFRHVDSPFAEGGVSGYLNGDGWPDVVTANSRGAALLLNDGVWGYKFRCARGRCRGIRSGGPH